jgi:hypothetical protein
MVRKRLAFLRRSFENGRLARDEIVRAYSTEDEPIPPRRSVVKHRRILQSKSPEEGLAEQAEADRERAKSLPPGHEREELLRNARRAETASHLAEWLNSPGLRPPK